MSDNNPINYSDLFNFGDKSEIQQGIAGIAELEKAYKEFYKTVSKGQLNRLSQQEKDLTKVKKELADATRNLSIAEREHQTRLMENLRAAEQTRSAEEALRRTREATIATTNQVRNGVTSLSAEYRKLRADYEAAFRAGDTAAMERISAGARNVATQIRDVTAALRATRPAFTAAAGSYNELDAITKKLVADLKALPGGMSNTSAEAKRLKKEIYDNTKQLKEFDRQMNQNFRNVGNYGSALSGLGGSLKSLILGYLSLQGAIMAVNATFNQALKSDAIRASLNFTFGSVDLADAKLEELLKKANQLGINYNALASSYKSFIGAVIAANYDLDQGERIFNAVAGASARLKLSAEDTEGALRALQQMISKGNVQAEELRGQLGERIPGAFSIAARAMGVTESALNDMLKKGEVLASDLLPKLAAELEKTFDTNSTQRVEGLSSAWQRLLNVFSGAVAESSNITGIFETIVSGLETVTSSIVKTVNSSSWAEFWARLTNTKAADAIRLIDDTSIKGGTALGNASNLDLSTATAKQVRMSYEEVKIAYKNANEALTEYKKNVADGTLVNKGKITVESLTNTVDALYTKMNQLNKLIPKASDAPKAKTQAELDKEAKDAERRQKEAMAAAKRAQSAANEIAKANAKLLITEAELEYAKSEQSLEDEIKFEDKKLQILNDSFAHRLKLYSKDSADYKQILAEKNDAETDNINRVNKAREDDAKKREREREKELKDIEQFEKAKAKAQGAEAERNLSQKEGGIKLDVATGKISSSEGNDQLFAARKEQMEADLQARRDELAKLSDIDADYFDKKAEVLDAEKALIDERSDYEIAKAEEVADRRKQLQDDILQYTGELTQSVFDLAGAFGERRIQKLEEERDYELSLAGNNADAKAKIEANYQKKIAQEKRKAAIADKAAAIIGIAINTAQAVLKVTAQTGILAPFIIPGIIALGALQAAIVAAKPIPKFAVGTRNAPEGPAIVGERGVEAIEENGQVRFSGPKAELTYLKKGAKVLTAGETKQKYDYEAIEDKRFGDQMLTSLLQGTGVVMNANNTRQVELMHELVDKAITPEQIEKAMAKAVGGLDIQQLFVDEKGYTTYLKRKNRRMLDQNSRNSFGGQG